jgi:formylmethanofuran dehydrogenase subunit D
VVIAEAAAVDLTAVAVVAAQADKEVVVQVARAEEDKHQLANMPISQYANG